MFRRFGLAIICLMAVSCTDEYIAGVMKEREIILSQVEPAKQNWLEQQARVNSVTAETLALQANRREAELRKNNLDKWVSDAENLSFVYDGAAAELERLHGEYELLSAQLKETENWRNDTDKFVAEKTTFQREILRQLLVSYLRELPLDFVCSLDSDKISGYWYTAVSSIMEASPDTPGSMLLLPVSVNMVVYILDNFSALSLSDSQTLKNIFTTYSRVFTWTASQEPAGNSFTGAENNFTTAGLTSLWLASLSLNTENPDGEIPPERLITMNRLCSELDLARQKDWDAGAFIIRRIKDLVAERDRIRKTVQNLLPPVLGKKSLNGNYAQLSYIMRGSTNIIFDDQGSLSIVDGKIIWKWNKQGIAQVFTFENPDQDYSFMDSEQTIKLVWESIDPVTDKYHPDKNNPVLIVSPYNEGLVMLSADDGSKGTKVYFSPVE